MSSLVTCLARLEGRVGRRPCRRDASRRRCCRADLVHLRRALGLGLGGVGDGRQHLVVDHDRLGGVLGLRQRLGDDDGDMVADIAHLALGQRRMRAGLHRRAVLGMDHPAADQPADLVVGEILAGEDVDHARACLRAAAMSIELDVGMGVRRAQEIGVGLAGAVDVVGVVALAGDEAKIFLAAHRRADSGRSHGGSSDWHRCLWLAIRQGRDERGPRDLLGGLAGSAPLPSSPGRRRRPP